MRNQYQAKTYQNQQYLAECILISCQRFNKVRTKLVIYNFHIDWFMILIYLVILTLLAPSQSGSIISNVPVMVSASKNYTTSQPQWLPSPYFRAGNEAVITTLTGNDKTPTYTFTFSSALPGLPNLAYGIKNYRGNDWMGQQFFEIKKIGLTAATFTVSIQIYGSTYMWLLTVAYLAVDPTFPHHLNTFDNVPVNSTGGNIVNITSKKSTLSYYTNYLNYTEQADGNRFTKFTYPLSSNNIVLYMTNLWIQATFASGSKSYPISLHIYTGIVNESFYWWNVTLMEQVMITNIHFSQVIFNTLDVQSSQQYFIVFSKWYNDKNGGFIQIPYQFVDNFIMGITSFETVDGKCGFQYQWEFTNQTVNGVSTFGVQLLLSWTLRNTCGFSWSESSIFYMQTWLCTPPYYYFNLTSSLCQTLCGGYTFENQTTYICDPCVNSACYQCDQPDKNQCTECATYLYYQLVNGDCACLAGYFQLNQVCVPCSDANAGCLLCTYDDGANGTLAYSSVYFTCTSCNNTLNYFIENKLCKLCTLSNCLACTNLSTCTTCSGLYNLSVALTCVRCLVPGCASCSATNSNSCGICNNTLGYYLTNSNTDNCQTECGDGIYVVGVEQCDDNNTEDYNGCSSACAVQSGFSCSGSPSVCYFASSVTLSLVDMIVQTIVCNTITFTFSINPASNTFSQSGIVWDDFIVTPNSSLLTPNASMYSYTNGNFSASYFMEQTIQGQTLVFGTNFSTLLPNSTIFENTESNEINVSVLPTNNITAEFRCCVGYYFDNVSKSCLQICGDGMVFDFDCDDNNTLNNDGCSPACQIQTDYVCVNGTTITPSICMFNGTVAVTLNYGNKDPTSNSLTLSYTISPIQPILNVLNNSYDFLSFVSVSNPDAVITSAIYNPNTNTLDVQVSYNQSIQGEPLDLIFTPPNVTQASLFPNISNSWVVSPTNHLSAVYYPQQVYDKVKKLQPYSTTLLALYLTISFFTLFFRKFIGLQLAALMQMGYLSLLLDNSLPAQLQVVSSWSFVFGYNSYYFSNTKLQAISQPFALYRYQRYFGYSCNVMLLSIVSVYGLSVVLLCLSAVTSRNLSRSLKNGGFLLLNQVGFALVVFSTPNILTAFFIQIKEGTAFSNSIFWSQSFLVLALASFLISNIVNVVNIQQSNDIGTFFRKHSQAGIYCSLIFVARIIVLTVFIFLYQIIGSICFFMLISIQFLYVILIILGRPHKKMLDLIRGATIQISLLFIFLVRCLSVSLLGQESSNIYSVLSMIEVVAYGVCIILSIISLIYHIGNKCKKYKIEPELFKEEEGNPHKIPNQSTLKINFPQKHSIEQSGYSKRKFGNNPIISDMEEIQTQTQQYGLTGKSQIRLDIRKQQKRYRRNRRQNQI